MSRCLALVFVLAGPTGILLGGCAEPTPSGPQWNVMTNYVPPPRRTHTSAAGVGTTPAVSRVGQGGSTRAYTGTVPAARAVGNNPARPRAGQDPLAQRSIGEQPRRRAVGTYRGRDRVGSQPGRSAIGSHSNTAGKVGRTP